MVSFVSDVQVRLHRTLEDIMEKDGKWIMRWKYAIAPKPVKPGVWRRKDGGFLVRGRAVDRRTGKLREIMKTVDGGDASGAYRFLQEEVEKVRSGEVRGQGARIRFGEYAASLFERKVTKGKIRSAKTREKWDCSSAESVASIRSISGWWRWDSQPVCGHRASGRYGGRVPRRTCAGRRGWCSCAGRTRGTTR
jgi:hypothetical protein